MTTFRWLWIVACLGMLAGCGEPESETPGTSMVFSLEGRVTPPPPAPPTAKITINPSQVELGETATIRITGHQAASFSALSTVSITPVSPAIEIASVQRISATELQARVIFHDFGMTGAKTLTVTRCTQLWNTNCSAKLTVKADPTPPTVTVNPSWIHQGETANRTFIGRSTHFDLAYTTIISETHGLSFTPLNFVRGRLWVEVTASPTVPVGTHTYTITTRGENVRGTIEVIPPAVLTAVTPDVIVQDEPTVVEVTGENTHFTAGHTTVSVSGGDVTVTDLAIVSPTTLRVTLRPAKTAPATVRTLTVTTSSMGETHTIPLAVARHAPWITGITPSAGRQGESTPVVLTLDYVDCATEVQSLRASVGTVRIDGCTDASHLRATVTFQETTPLGPMTLTLTTTWGATVSVPFTVLKGIPWMGMSPASLLQWTTNALLTADLHYDVWTPTVSVVSTNCAQLVIHDVQRVSDSRVNFRVEVPLTHGPGTCSLLFTSGVESEPMAAPLTILERTLNVEPTGQVAGTLTPASPVFVKITVPEEPATPLPVRIRATADAFTQIDPVITLAGADANFLSPMAQNDDEHEATLDAMVLFVPPAAGVYYARITDRLNLSSGNVTVDVATFEPPATIAELEPNDTWDASGFLPEDVFFVRGELSEFDLDVFTFAVPTNWNGAVVQVVAQGILPESGVNAHLQLRDADTLEWLAAGDDAGPWPDPRLFVGEWVSTVQAGLTHLSGGSHYWLSFAPAMQISEVSHDEANGWMGSFVELSGPPGAELTGCELRLSTSVFPERGVFLDEAAFDAFGWFVVAHDDWVPGAQLVDPQLAVDDPLGAVETVWISLYCGGALQSQVCYCPTAGTCPVGCVASPSGAVLGQGLMTNRWFLPQPEATPRAANPGKVP